ncbi:MAG: tyrosine-type recombinase/integrase [Muribaculaceae bacterium]|nr:tyrosine-type recombinase/integrase [Muribaculaceae bacterium]
MDKYGKVSVSFFVQRRKGYKEGNIRARVSVGGSAVVVSVGRNWPPEKWRGGVPKPNTTNAEGLTAKELSAVLSEFEGRARAVAVSCRSVEDLRRGLRGRTAMRVTAVSLASDLMRAKPVAANTEAAYMVVARSVDEACPSGLTQEGLRRWAEGMVARLSSSSFNRYMATLRAILKEGERRGLVPSMVLPESERVVRNEPLFLSPEEVARVEALRLEDREEEVRLRFVLQCHTGLRISDALAVTSGDVRGGVLRVRMRKTSEVLNVPLTSVAASVVSRLGLPMRWFSGYNNVLRRICRLAGVSGAWEVSHRVGGKVVARRGERWEFVTTHTGRRTFVCNCIAAGVHLNVIMSLTGHRGLQSIKPYLNVGEETRAKGIAALSVLMSGKK